MVGFFFVNFIPAFVDNYRKYQAVNFFKVTMVTFNDLHPLTNLKFCNAEALTCLSLYSDIFSDFKLEIRIKFELSHAAGT